MGKAFREKIRNRLLQRREELLDDVRSQLSLAAELRDEGSPDVADAGLQDDLKEFLHLLSDRQREAIVAYDQALQRLADGRYGICSSCGEPIDVHRLEVQPEASLCVACQSDLEQQEALRRGPGQGTL